MQWALVTTVEQPLKIWIDGTPFPDYSDGHWENITAVVGTIINLIVYDGTSEYSPPEGTKLEQVPDTAKLWDTGY